MNILGQRMFILNSLDDAVNLLEKQGAKTSDRPQLPMASDLMGWNRALVNMPWGERWRNTRKLMHQYIGGRGQLRLTFERFGDLEERETRKSCRRILRDQQRLVDHIRKLVFIAGSS